MYTLGITYWCQAFHTVGYAYEITVHRSPDSVLHCPQKKNPILHSNRHLLIDYLHHLYRTYW